MPDRHIGLNDYLIELVGQLGRINAQKVDIESTILRIRRRLGQAGGDIETPVSVIPRDDGTASAIQPKTFTGMSIPQAVKAFLAMSDRPQYTKAIADAIKRGGIKSESTRFENNVYTVLKRLKVSEAVVQVGTQWTLPNQTKAMRKPRARVTTVQRVEEMAQATADATRVRVAADHSREDRGR